MYLTFCFIHFLCVIILIVLPLYIIRDEIKAIHHSNQCSGDKECIPITDGNIFNAKYVARI